MLALLHVATCCDGELSLPSRMTPAAAGGASGILLAVAHDPSLLEHTAVASVTHVPSGSVAQLDPLLTPAAVTLLRRTGHPPIRAGNGCLG